MKPTPLGLRPRSIVAEERMKEIAVAVARYTEASMPIPKEWMEEWNELAIWWNRNHRDQNELIGNYRAREWS